MDDNYLIQEYIKTWDEKIISILFEKHLQYIFNVAFSFSLDKNKAQDITQDVCLKILKNIKTFTYKSSFKTWIYSITCNECLNQHKLKNTFVNTQSEELNEISDEINISDQYDKKYISQIITDEINQLDELDRCLIVSFYYENIPIKEIAKTFEMTESNVKVKLHRIKQNLKFKLEKYGIIN